MSRAGARSICALGCARSITQIGGLRAAASDAGHFHRKWTKIRPKFVGVLLDAVVEGLMSLRSRNRRTRFFNCPEPLPGMISTSGAFLATASSMIACSALSICSPRL